MSFQANRVLSLVRLTAFGAVTLFSVIVLALSAHILHTVGEFFTSFFNFAALALAVSILSLLTLPAMLLIGKLRIGALPSFIIVELGWLGTLWVLWLASGSLTASINFSGGNCGSGSAASTFCSEVNAIEAFAFLSWLTLLGYCVVLLTFSIQAYQRGNARVWFGTVKNTDFDARPTVYTHEKPYDSTTLPTQYPPSGMVTMPLQAQATPGAVQA